MINIGERINAIRRTAELPQAKSFHTDRKKEFMCIARYFLF